MEFRYARLVVNCCAWGERAQPPPVTTNQPNKHWPKIFTNDSTFTSAVLDPLLRRAETLLIEANSYRMDDRFEILCFCIGNGKGTKNMVVLPYKDRLELFSE